MLEVIKEFYDLGLESVKKNIPINEITSSDIYTKIVGMKYNIENDKLEKIDELKEEIEQFFENLESRYNEGGLDD